MQTQFAVEHGAVADRAPADRAVKDRQEVKLDLAAAMLYQSGSICLSLRGTSMLPALWPSDQLTIKSVAHGELIPGDIVLVMRDHRFFVHRLIKSLWDQGRLSWITKGDAAPRRDVAVVADELLGRVTNIQRGNRNFAPGRRISPLNFVLAWMLCHLNRFRGVALRVQAARLKAGSIQVRQFSRGVSSAMRDGCGVPTRSSP